VRFLTDENIPTLVVEALRAAGHDVLRVIDAHRAAPDVQVLQTAVGTDRILITFDSDFGRMIFAEGFAAPPGVIYLRSPPPSAAITAERVLEVIGVGAPTIDGHFVSVDRKARFHAFPEPKVR
jgi:predicted nuclease of predicted toxin-antitoxin system